MKLKGDAKFKGKLTLGLKNDIRNLVNFHASSRKSENLHFDGLLLSKAYKVLDEKVQNRYVLRNLVNFNASSGKSENFALWCATFCQKYIMFEPIKGRGVMCHNTEEWCKRWGATDLCFWQNLSNFDSTLESLKICTLMSYIWAKCIMYDLKNCRGVMCHDTEG